MKATLPAADVMNGKNLDGDKPFTMAIVIVDRKTGHEPVKAVIWHSQSKGSNFATVWAHGKLPGAFARHVAGHGRATGYGYHRPSAALGAAFDSAGIKLSEAIDGRGSQAMRDACIAVAVALGYKAANLVSVEV
jgi:hypothetical protein